MGGGGDGELRCMWYLSGCKVWIDFINRKKIHFYHALQLARYVSGIYISNSWWCTCFLVENWLPNLSHVTVWCWTCCLHLPDKTKSLLPLHTHTYIIDSFQSLHRYPNIDIVACTFNNLYILYSIIWSYKDIHLKKLTYTNT